MRCSIVVFFLCVLLAGCGSTEGGSTIAPSSLPAPPPVVLQTANLQVLEGVSRSVAGTVDGRPVALSLTIEDPTVATAAGSTLVGLKAGRTRFTAYGEGSLAQGELEVVSVAQVTGLLADLKRTTEDLGRLISSADQERSRNAALLTELRGHTEGAAATLAEIRQHLSAAAQDGPSSDVSASGRAIQALLSRLNVHASGAAGVRLSVFTDIEQIAALTLEVSSQIDTLSSWLGSSNQQSSITNSATTSSSASTAYADALKAAQQAAKVAAQAANDFVTSLEAELTGTGTGRIISDSLVGIVGVLSGPAAVIAADTLLSNVASQATNTLSSLNQAEQSLNGADQAVRQAFQSAQGSAGQGRELRDLLQALLGELQSLGQAVQDARVQTASSNGQSSQSSQTSR